MDRKKIIIIGCPRSGKAHIQATIVIEPAGVGRNPYACRLFYVSREKT